MSKIGVKFVQGGKVYNFLAQDDRFENADKIVVESIRGLELAYVAQPTAEEVSDEIISIVRVATDDDIKKVEELKKQEKKVITLTNELIKKYNLDMKLVDASFTLDGSKVIINYVCEDRVDFRGLVKDLASQLKLRIELRQIGIRDQAKKIGGIGFCGKECCCKKYLNDFDKVSIKMAKTQGLSLNPTKISGICGRLMCCLSYENEFYSEVAGNMPKINAKVCTPDGDGVVVFNNILKQIVTVKVENENVSKTNEYELNQISIIQKDVDKVNNSNNKCQKNTQSKNIQTDENNDKKIEKKALTNTDKQKEEKSPAQKQINIAEEKSNQVSLSKKNNFKKNKKHKQFRKNDKDNKK